MANCHSGHTNPPGQPYCGECGAALPELAQLCPNGHSNPQHHQYCGVCGVALPVTPETMSSSTASLPSAPAQPWRNWSAAGPQDVFPSAPSSPGRLKPGWSVPRWGWAAAVGILIVAVSAIVTHMVIQPKGERTGAPSATAGQPSSGSPSGSFQDWVGAVCQDGNYRQTGTATSRRWMCRGNPYDNAFSTLVFIAQFPSQADMQAHPEVWSGRYNYATCAAGDHSVTVFVSDVSGIGSKDDAAQLTSRSLQPLAGFGCTITAASPYAQSPSQQPMPAPAPSTPWLAPQPTSPPQSGESFVFQTPSGNIACRVGPNQGEGYADCHLAEHDFSPVCPEGSEIRVVIKQGERPQFEGCDKATLVNGQHVGLLYGNTWRSGAITCDSEEAGITCTDATTGHFFKLARQSYQLG